MLEPAQAHFGDRAQRFLTFLIDERLYALPAEEVAEVRLVPQVACVPQAPRSLLGLANLRGTVVPLASLRRLLGQDQVQDVATLESSRAIVLSGAAPMAVTVDRVHALVAIEAGRLETRQAALSAEPGELLRGAFVLGKDAKVAKILDIQALLSRAFAAKKRAPKPARVAPIGRAQVNGVEAEPCQKLVSFEIAGQEYAFELAAVHEIIVAPRVFTADPRSDSVVLGVSAYRDTLLPLLSLRGLLGFPPAETRDEREKVVIVRVGGVFVGLAVDRMRSVFDAESHLMEPPSALLAARSNAETQVKAVYRGGGQRLVSVLSPEQLFREDVMRRLTSSGDLPQAVAVPLDETGGGRKFLVFHLGEDEFALPIEAVDEVARVPDQITRVPKTPEFLEGVVNLRGEVLPVVDQRKRFDMPILVSGGNRRLIVVRSADFRAGLIVDSVSGVLGCLESAIEAAPDFAGATAQLVNGVLNLDQAGRIVLLLDPSELLSNAERGLLESLQAEAEQTEAKHVESEQDAL